jgi:hypothetical protein
MRRAFAGLLLVGACSAWSQPAPLYLGDLKLIPASCGVRRTLWIEHYRAELFVPAGDTVAAVGDPGQPKALRLRILNALLMPRDIPGRWRKALEPVIAAGAMAQLRAAYDGLRTDDLVEVTYLPRHGLTLSVNGRPAVQVPGHRAIDALLHAWALEMPAREKLQQAAMNHPCT